MATSKKVLSEQIIDKKINEIILKLDKYGKNYDKYEYGLPLNEKNIKEMNQIIKKIIID